MVNVLYNYSKLRGRIVEKFGSNARFAHKVGISEHTLSIKLNSRASFKQDEIEKCIALLDIPKDEVGAYFFCQSSSQM